ncbi:MAG: flagellar motor switch protein FliM, partial [Rickettsiales bacterium]
HAILDKALMAYEKLPMLEVVFDRLVRMMATSLRNFMSDNVEVSIESMTSLRFGDYLDSIPLPALLVVFRAVEWENYGLVTVDSSQIYSTVDLLLGGRRTKRPIRIEGRPYTTIEQDIVKSMVDVVLADLSAAFDPICPAPFKFDRLETNPRFTTIARNANAALLVRLRIEMEDRGGNLDILFPHATLEPIRELLLQMFTGENFGQDIVWNAHFGKEVRNTNVNVDAVMHETKMPLGEIMRLQVGTTVILNCKPEDEIKLKCGSVELTTGKLGKTEDKVAIRLSNPVSESAKESLS